jgi:hypothetical protein
LSHNAIYAKKTVEMEDKVWCLLDSKSKYVYDFEIYCGRNDNGVEESKNVVRAEGSVATNVVFNLMNGLEVKGHVVVTDSYFTSVGLYMELVLREIYATRTVRSNRGGVLRPLNNLRNWMDNDQRTLEWRMHSSRRISCVVWKDKCSVLLLPINAVLVQLPCIPLTFIVTIPRRNRVV